MKQVLSLILFTLLSTLSFSQTKEETISYINNILRLHNNGTMYHSVRQVSSNVLSADNTLYMEGTNSMTLNYLYEAKDAMYLSTNIRENRVGTLLISFKTGTVKILGADGKPMQYEDKISMEGLVDISILEMGKLKKAFTHLIKLFGGQIKEDPF